MRGRAPLFHAHCGAHDMTSLTYRCSTDATSQEEVPYTIWRSLTTLAGVLMRDRTGRFRYKVRKNSHVKRSRDQRGSCKLGCWGQPATTRNSEQACTDSSLKLLEGAWPHLQLHCGFRSLQNFGRINSCCLKWPKLQLFVMGTLGNEYNSCTNEMHRACRDTVRGPNKTKNSFCPLVFCELSMTSGVTSRHTLLE